MIKALVVSPGTGVWCEQCGEWPARYCFKHAGLCFGCAYDDRENHAALPDEDLSLIRHAVLLVKEVGASARDMEGAPTGRPAQNPTSYARGVADLLGTALGLPGDLLDSVMGWLAEPHNPGM